MTDAAVGAAEGRAGAGAPRIEGEDLGALAVRTAEGDLEVAERTGALIRVIPLDKRGDLDMEAYLAMLGPRRSKA